MFSFDEVLSFLYHLWFQCLMKELIRNSLPSPNAQRLTSLFASKSFMAWGLTFRLVIYFELISVYGVKYRVKLFLWLMHYHAVVPAPFVEKAILSIIELFWRLCQKKKKNQLAINVRAYFWIPDSVPLSCVSLLVLIPHCLDYGQSLLKLGSLAPQAWFLIFKTVLALQDPTYFQINLRLSLSISGVGRKSRLEFW